MKFVRSVQYWSIILRFSTLTISLFLPISPVILAQGIQAQVRSVTGVARLTDKTRPGVFAIKRKDQIEPGSIIETGYNGRVVISLGDGSQVTVLPNSKVVLKNSPTAHSARELLDILVGRVLVKIQRIGGKPNPYRLNSPSASIAVRGTEFIVDVLQNGETLVVVQEGQVEVWPHSNPDNRRLVTPGGRVIVRPGGDISLAFPGPGSELNGRTRFNRDIADIYQKSVDSLVQTGEISPAFFSAFPDPHLDSLENPAYAAEFKNAEGRLSFLPSISARHYDNSTQYFGSLDIDQPIPHDFSLAPQLTFYAPIPGSRLTVGGSVSALRTRLHDIVSSGDEQAPNYYFNSNALKFTAFNTSLIAAYNFGATGKTSVGIGVDKLAGGAYFLNTYESNWQETKFKRLTVSNARLKRTRLTLGLVHKFSEASRLGIYYRYSINSSDQQNHDTDEGTESSFPFVPWISIADRSIISTGSSEVGIRFRAPITRRLFYGVEGSYLYERINSRQTIIGQTLDERRFLGRRARIGAGLGFALTSRILLSVDIAGGLYNTSKPSELYYLGIEPRQTRDPEISIIPNPSMGERGKFRSLHSAARGRIWRNLFASASYLKTVRKDTRYYYYNGVISPYGDREVASFSSFSVGWSFKPGLTAEYLFSTENRRFAPSHSLMLRYTFNLNIKDE
jgi:FecR protein